MFMVETGNQSKDGIVDAPLCDAGIGNLVQRPIVGNLRTTAGNEQAERSRITVYTYPRFLKGMLDMNRLTEIL